MLNSPKFLIIVALAGLGLFFFLIFAFPPFSSLDDVAVPGGLPPVSTPEFRPPDSAFVPAESGGRPVVEAPPAPSAIEPPKFEVAVPSVEAITRMVGDALGRPSVAPPPTALLELPTVSDDFINITPDGPSDFVGYVESIAVGAFEEIEFDGRRFEEVLFDENNLPLLPHQLIERGLASGDFAELVTSLSVFRDFLSVKEKFVRSLPVSGAAVATAKESVALDSLLLTLMDKALAVARGEVAIEEVEDFYRKFQTTADFHHERLLRGAGLASYKDAGLFGKIAKFLAGGNVASAQLPFGTFIGPPIFCTCSFSFWIPTGPPVPTPTGALNANLAWIASPAFFPFKSLRPGAAWIGNYSPSPVPCLQFILFGCAPIPGVGNPPIIAGTSI